MKFSMDLLSEGVRGNLNLATVFVRMNAGALMECFGKRVDNSVADDEWLSQLAVWLQEFQRMFCFE